MTVKEISVKLSLEVISMPDPDREVDGCYIGDLLSWVMGRAESGNAWITIMSNSNIVAVATLTDVSCIILAEGVTLEESVSNLAKDKGINIFTSKETGYTLAAALSRSIENE